VEVVAESPNAVGAPRSGLLAEVEMGEEKSPDKTAGRVP
jgi:hypothetical protein